MFRFAEKGIVFWPVTLRQAGADDDQVQDVTVHLAYRVLTRKELRAREAEALGRIDVDAIRNAKSADELTAQLAKVVEREDADLALLLDRVSDWRGFVDADEQPLAFSRERLAALLEYDHFYKPALAGLSEASRAGRPKNLLPGSGGTPAVVQA